MAYPILRRTLLAWYLRWRPHRIEGLQHLPTTGPVVLAINHHGYLDAPIVAMVVVMAVNRKPYFLTKQSVAEFFRRLGLLNWLGMIGVNRADPAACLDEAGHRLEQGEVVGIFPEGKRNPEGVLSKPKTGVARLAFRTAAPIVPVGIVMPDGMTAMEAVRNAFHRSRPVTVRFGQPIVVPVIAPDALRREDLDELMSRVMREIAALSGKSFEGSSS